MTAPEIGAEFNKHWETDEYIQLHTNKSTPDLDEEHHARGDLEILAHLEISCEEKGQHDDVVTPHRELPCRKINRRSYIVVVG
jgi:hypothetical protein